MTDITELAQSLKAAAEKSGVEKWQVKRSGPGEYEVIVKGSLVKRNGWSTYRPVTEGVVDKKTADFIALANPANILALVEALEKARQRNSELETYSKTTLEFREAARDENRHLKLELEIAEKRIAELEESHAQVIQSRDHYKRMSEEGLKHLVESSTVTVKLPKLYGLDFCDRIVPDSRNGFLFYSEDITAALTAAGIKWEAE